MGLAKPIHMRDILLEIKTEIYIEFRTFQGTPKKELEMCLMNVTTKKKFNYT